MQSSPLDAFIPIDPFAGYAHAPAWRSQHEPQMFGKKDDDEDDDESDDDDDDGDGSDDDDDAEDDPDEGKSEDELKAELKEVRAAIKTANGSSAKRRRKIRELEAQIAGKKPADKKDDKGDDEKPDVEAITREAALKGKGEGLAVAKRLGARAALLEAGVPKAKLDRAARMLDLDDVDIDDDGELDGLDDAVASLKKDVPEFFGKVITKRRSVAGDGDRDGSGKGKKLTATQRQANMLLGKS